MEEGLSLEMCFLVYLVYISFFFSASWMLWSKQALLPYSPTAMSLSCLSPKAMEPAADALIVTKDNLPLVFTGVCHSDEKLASTAWILSLSLSSLSHSGCDHPWSENKASTFRCFPRVYKDDTHCVTEAQLRPSRALPCGSCHPHR